MKVYGGNPRLYSSDPDIARADSEGKLEILGELVCSDPQLDARTRYFHPCCAPSRRDILCRKDDWGNLRISAPIHPEIHLGDRYDIVSSGDTYGSLALNKDEQEEFESRAEIADRAEGQ